MKQLLIFIIILLISTIVSSHKKNCKDPKLKCIELCCGMTQYYNIKFRKCDYVEEFVKASLLLDNNKIKTTESLEIVEYGKCDSNVSVIKSCYSPYYDPESNEYLLEKLIKVPCNRFQIIKEINPIGLLIFGMLVISMLLMLLYTCVTKEKKDNLSFKLVTWYFTCMVATILGLAIRAYYDGRTDTSQDSPLLYLILTPDTFLIASCLWLSAIGYEIWVRFKESNSQSNSVKVRKRFIWYSIYVWGITTTIFFADTLTLEYFQSRSSLAIMNGPIFLIATFNIIIFLVLSVKICLIRCSVAQLTDDKYFLCHTVCVIIRLCIMMGIPRMLAIILHPLPFIGDLPMTVMHFVDPYLVFIAFLAEKENARSLLCSRCCRSRCLGQENAQPTETI